MKGISLAAIYIEDHEYLFDNEPQTINLGGKYFYSFTKEKETIKIDRMPNEHYIEGFFDEVKLESKLTNISAIVGSNGAGKTSILDVIRRSINNVYETREFKALFLFEIKNKFRVFKINTDSKFIFNNEFLDNQGSDKINTVYYSPIYNYKYNSLFNYEDKFDFSLENLMRYDTEDRGHKSRWYSIQEEIIFRNTERQVNFLNSKIINNQSNIFKSIFNLPEHGKFLLSINQEHLNETFGEIKYFNLPSSYLQVFQLIFTTSKKESAVIDGIKLKDQEKIFFRRNILHVILWIILERLDEDSIFLNIGDIDNLQLDANNPSIEILLNFLKHAKLILSNAKVAAFSDNSIEFIDLLFKSINENKITILSDHSATIDDRDLFIKLLRLQLNFRIDLLNYFTRGNHKYKSNTSNAEKIFIPNVFNFSPFSKRLSSGENALLNLFASLNEFTSKVKESAEIASHYIFLIDEGDLGFHLIWKKKFVFALTQTLPYFFNEIEGKPSFQIIFTTHDPVTLSDMPNSNVIYLKRKDYDSPSTILEISSSERPIKTFGANISELVADSFFLEGALIGEFAEKKVEAVIKWLNDKRTSKDADKYLKTISLIDEPILKFKLLEMYGHKMGNRNTEIDILEQEKRRIQDKLDRLKSNKE